MPSGGYQKPSNPAPASGPGALSRRTDGGPGQPVRDLPGGPYGSGTQFKQMEQSAPMAGSPAAPSSVSPSPPPASPLPVTPFNAPTQNPSEPVTAGASLGPGVGPDAMGLQDPRQQIDQEDAKRLLQWLPVLEWTANQPGASQALRTYVRQIKVLAA